MHTIQNLTANEVKSLQVLLIRNETRLYNITQEKDLTKEVKKLYRDELKGCQLLQKKLRINLY